MVGLSKIVGGVLLLLILIGLLFMMFPFVRDLSTNKIDSKDPFKSKTAIPKDCVITPTEGAKITIVNTGWDPINMSPISPIPFSNIKNLPQNTNFEKDTNDDGVPDGWDISNITADIVLVTDLSISMQNCMDASQPSDNCPADASGRPLNCTREVPCTNVDIPDCSAWTANNEERYCNETTAYFKTTYKKISEGPIGYWALDMVNFTNHALDSSGNRNHGTLYGYDCNPARCNITGGQVNESLKFDGVNDYVSLGNPAALKLTGAMTVSAWVMHDTLNDNLRIVSKGGGSTDRGWGLSTENSNPDIYCFQIATGAGTNLNACGTPSDGPVIGIWTHLVGVYTPSVSLALYKDGIKITENSVGIPALQRDSTMSVNIGRRADGCCMMDGLIDEVKIYNRSLSADEILAEYNKGLNNLDGNCIITDSNNCLSPYSIKADSLPNISAGSQNLASCGGGYPYAYEYVLNNCAYENGTTSADCAPKIYSGNYKPPVNKTKAAGLSCGGCSAGECDVGTTYSICNFYNRTAYAAQLNCRTKLPPDGYIYNNGTMRTLAPYYNATCVAWALQGAANYSGCAYNDRTACGAAVCVATGQYANGTTRESPTYPRYKTSCTLPGECAGAANYSGCVYKDRSACGAPACTAIGPPYANGTTNNIINYYSSCTGVYCDATPMFEDVALANCGWFNKAACDGASTYGGWIYSHTDPGTSFIQSPSCTIPPQCYISNNYTNCAYVNRTAAAINSCTAPAIYNISKRYESSIWRTGLSNPCLANEVLEDTQNIYVCVEAACGAGYDNALPGDCTPGCPGGNTCCKKQNQFNYECGQYSDNCCEKDSEICRQQRDYACERRKCSLTQDACCDNRDFRCSLTQDACCTNRDYACQIRQDACCTTSQKICQSREYECCDRLTKCYPQETKCCEPTSQICSQNTYSEVASCTPGYSNGAPDVSANGCTGTEKCDIERSCSYCENVAVRLAKKLDRNFTETMIGMENRVGLVSYGTTATDFTEPSNNLGNVISEINSYQANAGQTCISCALNKSIELLKNSPNPRFIVLMSDGAANMLINPANINLPGTYDEDGVEAQAEALALGCLANSSYGITIYTIGFGNAAGSGLLQDIADCTGGNFSQGNSAEELNAIYHKVTVEIAGRLDDTTKVYGNYSMKIGGGENRGAESEYIDVRPSYNYTFGNYLMLDIETGDFFVILQLFNSSLSNIVNVTLAQYSNDIPTFQKENYNADLSSYATVKYAKVIYMWHNDVDIPAGTAWVDYVFFGPKVVCKKTSSNKYACGEMTIEKIAGEGDIYPFASKDLFSSYTDAQIKDINCASDQCSYLVCSPDVCTPIDCNKKGT